MYLHRVTGLFLLFLLVALPAGNALAAAIEEHDFDTVQQEERYKKLTFEMRCPKCINSNLAGSDAPIAADLRKEIYDQIMEGRSDREIIEFMTSRYGDFMLYKPRLTPATFFLWFGPLILLLAGFFIVRRMMLASNAEHDDAALSAEEQEALHLILDNGKDN